jgi:hypothetical protein
MLEYRLVETRLETRLAMRLARDETLETRLYRKTRD